MKIALAQIDTTVGDLRGNLALIRAYYRRAAAQGADLVLAPELALTGYPPWDLLEQRDFVAANLQTLKELARDVRDAGLCVGFVDVNARGDGKRLFNAAAMLHRGKIAAIRHKSLLPTYDVFDEARYFEPAAVNLPVNFKGVKLGLTICEDAWNDATFWKTRLYRADPVQDLARRGARLLLNISSSPYHRGKGPLRVRMLHRQAARHRRPLLYCNLVGGNDELIFDGRSLAFDAKGRLMAQGRAFEEDLVFVDMDKPATPACFMKLDDADEVYRALVLGLRDYVRKCGFHDVLVGLSGGIDSAVTCALASEALGPSHVTAVSMPSMYSSPGSITDADALARNLGVRMLNVPITAIYTTYMDGLSEPFAGSESGVAEQNLQARIRGNLLMALSNKTGALLLSTGNKSELSVGYCTLYGDMSGGLAAIGDVPKTTVYELARFINREREIIPQASILKPPSAELKPDQKDQDDLPPYDLLDAIIQGYVEDGLGAAEIIRRGHPASLVHQILDRIDRNEYKRRQAAPGLKITPKAFGIGRRMPIARGSHRPTLAEKPTRSPAAPAA